MAIINQDWISQAVTSQPIGFWADIDDKCYVGGLVRHPTNINNNTWTVAGTSDTYIEGVLLAINPEGKGFIATRGVVTLTCDSKTDTSLIITNELVQIYPSDSEAGKVKLAYGNGALTADTVAVSHIILAGDRTARKITISL